MKDSLILKVLIAIILIGGTVAATVSMVNFIDYPKFDNSYKKDIDSLTQLVELNNKKFSTLDSNSRLEQEKINKLQKQLSDLSYKTSKNLKHYEEEINRLNRLTDSQLVIKFTDIFDYD
jgi:septal ring factor EnvC (AmiA/AmiB activator)